MFGDLLLNHGFAVNKNKSLLLITGEESSSGSIKLVTRLDKPATEWEPLPGGLGAIDALLQWLKQSIMQDEEFRFEWEDGDVESAPAGFSGWVTKVLKLGTKEFKAPRNRHGHAAEEKPLRLCLHKDLKKKFDKHKNAVYAEVHSFRFTEDTIGNREDVESRCRAAADGHVLFWAWTDKRSEHLQASEAPHPTIVIACSSLLPPQAMPLKHIAQLNESTGISDKDWKTHLKRQQDELEKTKPKAIVCATGVDIPIVSKDVGLSLEDAFERKASCS